MLRWAVVLAMFAFVACSDAPTETTDAQFAKGNAPPVQIVSFDLADASVPAGEPVVATVVLKVNHNKAPYVQYEWELVGYGELARYSWADDHNGGDGVVCGSSIYGLYNGPSTYTLTVEGWSGVACGSQAPAGEYELRLWARIYGANRGIINTGVHREVSAAVSFTVE